jgi:hypothetical protein
MPERERAMPETERAKIEFGLWPSLMKRRRVRVLRTRRGKT